MIGRRAPLALLLLAGCVAVERVGELPRDAGVDAAPADAATPSACLDPMPCPDPAPGAFSLTAQLYDLERAAPLRADDPTAAACDPGNPSADGPCAACVAVYVRDELVADRVAAAPLDARAITVDDCGRVCAESVAAPIGEALVVLVGDCGAVDRVVPTLHALAADPGARVDGARLDVAPRATEIRWTAAAGVTSSVVADGACVVTFVGDDEPAIGVRVTLDGAAAPSAYYFADDGITLAQLDPSRDATSDNGAAVVRGCAGVVGGFGQEPPGCAWTTARVWPVPGAMWVQRKDARFTSSGASCR